MTPTRALSLTLLLGSLAACSDASSDSPASTGAGGTAGAGGTSGAGGQPQAGSAGQPQAGAGGQAQAGSGGQAQGGSAGAADGLPCEIETLLANRCQSCHSNPTKFGAPMPLVTRADLLAKPPSGASATIGERSLARMQDEKAPMPQPPNPKATDAEIAQFKAWLDAGMPASAGCGAGGAGGAGGAAGSAGSGGTSNATCTPDAVVKATTPWTIKQTDPDRYACFGGKIKATGNKRQITEVSVNIDNTVHTHHICIYDTGTKENPTTPEVCSPGGAALFGKLLYCWAPGADPNTLPPEAGFPLDATKDTNILVEMHYSNLQGSPDSLDNSAVNFCTTGELRPYDADVMAFGSVDFKLPPAQSSTVDNTVVAQKSLMPEGWIRVVRGWPHMHLLGTAFYTDVIRNGDKVGDLGSTSTYSFSNQISYPVDVQLLPGDQIRTRCVFNNTTTDSVSFGENTASEMCYNFVTYYPRIEAPGWTWATPSISTQAKVYPTP